MERLDSARSQEEKSEAAFAEALKYGLPAAGSLGRACIREFTAAGQKEVYDNASPAVKKQMRADWVAEKWGKIQERKQKWQVHSKKTIADGRYLLPFKILEEQGGPKDPEAIKGTRKILYKCCRMAKMKL